MAHSAFGRPQIDPPRSSKFPKPFAIESGDNYFTIIPFPNTHSQDGSWFCYHRQHWGYNGSRDDGGKTYVTFECVEEKDFKTKVIQQHCPECDLIAERSADFNSAKTKLETEVKVGKITVEQAADLLQPQKAWLDAHNLQKKYYLHVAKPTGEIGYILLGWEAFDQLRTEMKRLEAEGEDVWNLDNALVFKITKAGEGRFGTSYKASVGRTKVKTPEGKTYEEYSRTSITEAQLDAALPSMPNLYNLVTTIPAALIQQLTQTDDEPEKVNAVMAQHVKPSSKPSIVAKIKELASELPSEIKTATSKVEVVAPKVVAAPAAPTATPSAPSAANQEKWDRLFRD